MIRIWLSSARCLLLRYTLIRLVHRLLLERQHTDALSTALDGSVVQAGGPMAVHYNAVNYEGNEEQDAGGRVS